MKKPQQKKKIFGTMTCPTNNNHPDDGDGKGNLSVGLVCRGERGFWIKI